MAPHKHDNSLSRIAGLRGELVNTLRRQGLLRTARVEAAFRNVPRHLFVPHVDVDRAYSDQSISVKEHGGVSISSSSQPAIMALMLEQLDVRPGQRVLEIGAGTGYNAALLAYLTGAEGRVVTVDIDEDLAEAARHHLGLAGYAERVEVIADDGGYGFPEAAPYDRIIVTASVWDIIPSWWTQLKQGGRLVLPVSLRGPQLSAAFEHRGTYLEALSLEPCGFMELRGEFAPPFPPVELPDVEYVHLYAEVSPQPAPETLLRWMTGPAVDYDTGIEVTPREVGRGIEYWLALNEPGACRMLATSEAAQSGFLPPLFGYYASGAPVSLTGGAISETGLCLMMRPPIQKGVDDLMNPQPFRLWLRVYGSDDSLGERVAASLRLWDAAGRRGGESLRLRAYPVRQPVEPAPNEFVIPKRWTTLVAAWPELMVD